MSSEITVREAAAPTDVEAFWTQLHEYFTRDLFPDPEDEDRDYFLGSEYREQMQHIHDRGRDRCHYLFFCSEGRDVGFAMPVIYDSEDGKCFIMEFCVYPEFRGKGIGRMCAEVMLNWAWTKGACYAELNCGREDRSRFWKSLGFRENGADEWGEPLMILPPEEDVPIKVEALSDPEDWQLYKLENGFLKEIGEQPLEEAQQERLSEAIRAERITFFVAKRGCRMVGMCSVAKYFSTFGCRDTGVFEDFYIEPVFRGKGIARQLCLAVLQWAKHQGLASITVSCAPCDEALYNALGFDTRLGITYAHII